MKDFYPFDAVLPSVIPAISDAPFSLTVCHVHVIVIR